MTDRTHQLHAAAAVQLSEKRRLLEALLGELRREAEAMEAAARAAHEGATHEENKPEHDKDTRAVEASYLAGAQAERARELKEAVGALTSMRLREFEPGAPVALGAAVTLAQDGTEAQMRCLMAPQAGGLAVEFEGARWQVTTPRSPLGRALLGKCAGDVVEVQVGGARREYEVVAVD